MLSSAVGGRAELRHVQGLLTKAPADLHARLLKETRAAMRPTQSQVKASALRLPSGYAPTMARAVRVATRVTSAGSSIQGSVRVSAQGRAAKRDVNRIDAGILRHPLFGRRLKWYTTMAKPRFVRDPIVALGKRIHDGAERAANDTADTIVRG